MPSLLGNCSLTSIVDVSLSGNSLNSRLVQFRPTGQILYTGIVALNRIREFLSGTDKPSPPCDANSGGRGVVVHSLLPCVIMVSKANAKKSLEILEGTTRLKDTCCLSLVAVGH